MSGSLINIQLPVKRVCELLGGLEGVEYFDVPEGLGLEFAPGEVARVLDASPDAGTDIHVSDPSETVARRLYDVLTETTTAVVWMTDVFSEIIATRGVQTEELDRAD